MRWILAALVVAVLVSLAVVAFALYDARLKDRHLHRAMGRLLADQAMLIRHWEELESGVQFGPYAQQLVLGRSRPGYQTRFISVTGGNDGGKPVDAFERQVIERFGQPKPSPPEAAAPPEFTERIVRDQRAYQYYQAVRAGRHCLSMCHGAIPGGPGSDLSTAGVGLRGGTKLAEGDLMAVVQVTIPLAGSRP